MKQPLLHHLSRVTYRFFKRTNMSILYEKSVTGSSFFRRPHVCPISVNSWPPPSYVFLLKYPTSTRSVPRCLSRNRTTVLTTTRTDVLSTHTWTSTLLPRLNSSPHDLEHYTDSSFDEDPITVRFVSNITTTPWHTRPVHRPSLEVTFRSMDVTTMWHVVLFCCSSWREDVTRKSSLKL